MVSLAEKYFLPGRASFLSFLAKGSRKNKCRHLCQMGARWNFCVPQLDTQAALQKHYFSDLLEDPVSPVRLTLRPGGFDDSKVQGESFNRIAERPSGRCGRHGGQGANTPASQRAERETQRKQMWRGRSLKRPKLHLQLNESRNNC